MHRRSTPRRRGPRNDGFEEAAGQVLFLRRRQLRDQEVEEDRQLLPRRVGVRQDLRQEAVGPDESLNFALEVDLAILVEVLLVTRYAGMQIDLWSGCSRGADAAGARCACCGDACP